MFNARHWDSTKLFPWKQINCDNGMSIPIIIFAGSFNPPTTAHRKILTELQAELPGVSIVVLPAPRTPHKDPASLAPFEHRMDMCRLMVRGLPDVTVSDFATTVDSDQTIDIIEAWRTQNPDAHIIWVMGADSFVSLPVWHRWREVMETVAIYVLARADLTADIEDTEPAVSFATHRTREAAMLASGNSWYVHPEFHAPVSATAARAGDTDMVLQSVRDYIVQHDLYADPKAKKTPRVKQS